MGQSAWDELIRMEGQIRKQRQETLYAQARRRRKFIEILSIILATGIGAGLLITFILALKALS